MMESIVTVKTFVLYKLATNELMLGWPFYLDQTLEIRYLVAF